MLTQEEVDKMKEIIYAVEDLEIEDVESLLVIVDNLFTVESQTEGDLSASEIAEQLEFLSTLFAEKADSLEVGEEVCEEYDNYDIVLSKTTGEDIIGTTLSNENSENSVTFPEDMGFDSDSEITTVLTEYKTNPYPLPEEINEAGEVVETRIETVQQLDIEVDGNGFSPKSLNPPMEVKIGSIAQLVNLQGRRNLETLNQMEILCVQYDDLNQVFTSVGIITGDYNSQGDYIICYVEVLHPSNLFSVVASSFDTFLGNADLVADINALASTDFLTSKRKILLKSIVILFSVFSVSKFICDSFILIIAHPSYSKALYNGGRSHTSP